MSSIEAPDALRRPRGGLRPYVAIARVDHWFKNTFMVLGVVLAFFYRPELFTPAVVPRLALAVLATCLVASSNYVLNELLDGRLDALHPEKRFRPVPSGLVMPVAGYLEWVALGAVGLALALTIAPSFAAAAAALWVMGVIYNVPPIRTKDWPYLDVLSEAVNNPIRLLLGWFALVDQVLPPLSLLLSYWMIGAFFMAVKRYAELRHLGDQAVAAAYRRSFAHYTEARLLISIVFYATACALFAGIFIVRYHLELILFTPLAAGLFAHYLKLGLLADSPTQRPERLYRHRGFVVYLIACFVVFLLLMFTEIPALYRWFNVDPATNAVLWRIG